MAGRQLNPPLVSVNIPCYRQLEHARRSVDSILAQTFGDFEITLLDDGASDEYRDYAASLGDARVRYQRNPERLGAMRNMFQAINAGHGKYSMAFHEDDLLGSHYLATAVRFLEDHPGCGFIGGELREFTAEPPARGAGGTGGSPDDRLVRFQNRFPARRLSRGRADVRVDRLSPVRARRTPRRRRHVRHAGRPAVPAGDLAKWSCAVIRDPLTWYRRHGDGDRHMAMNAGPHPQAVYGVPRRVSPAVVARGPGPVLRLHWILAVHAVPTSCRRRRGSRCGGSCCAHGARAVPPALVARLQPEAADRAAPDRTMKIAR
jgi:hypothetical protein